MLCFARATSSINQRRIRSGGGGVLKEFQRRDWQRPVVLLPGNHDPLNPRSVYHRDHPFRAGLPGYVHVVDRPGWQLPLGEDAAVFASPCTSHAGQTELAEALPARAADDQRIRIGLLHGQTFDIEGHQTNFPIARGSAAARGFDYLAIGDTHAFREVEPDAPGAHGVPWRSGGHQLRREGHW